MAKGLLLFVAATFVYCGSIFAAAAAPLWWVQATASLAAGLWAGVLFVIGHDACHGSLTPNPRLNRLIATASFLPALHPYTSWKHSHNGLHHGWTNVRGKEVVYVPFSKRDYDQLPRWRRRLERFFRSPFGCATFYFLTVYLAYELFPNRQRGPKGNGWRAFQWERALVICFAVTVVGASIFAANATGRPLSLALLFTTAIPATCYFGLMSVVTLLHHTHPRVPWYAGADEFNYFGIVRATVHVALPRPLEIVLHDILQHSAHHADTRIPLYNLAESQRAIEASYPEVVHERLTWRGFLRTLRTCRLYDYESHRWLDFDGMPTSEPHVIW